MFPTLARFLKRKMKKIQRLKIFKTEEFNKKRLKSFQKKSISS